jgi:hypothetical protein
VQVWAVGNFNHLHVHYLNQTGWHTDDHGNANGLPFNSYGLAVTTYWDGSFNQIQVWAVGSDYHLYAHYYNQTGWHTDDHGDANGHAFYSAPAVLTYWDGSFTGVQVWARGDDFHLHVHYLNQTGWHTDDHGDANGKAFFAPAVLTYWFTEVQVWAVGSDYHLHVHYYNQTGWHTEDHGNANGMDFLGRAPAVTTYWDGSFLQVHVWDVASGHLYVHYYDAYGWHTDDHGIF